ncbi:hypothetical protein [Chitinophaga sp. sic0106]|uniref:hypothetical protein n=1 Tax=Chitinophaga sp. sic0106 TaxID=2854785 RepID=UPI001C43C79F|nr:hypothetical protein [Chitinophaga sp. sic0106]MBV7531286.1 hypothetical protein [Chitinophaga sp. sic0106]
MRAYFIFLLLLGSQLVKGQSLADLERQLDSLLRKNAKSELVASLGYGNNPAYGSKVPDYNAALVMKTFVAPSLTYYHNSGFYAGFSGYYLFDAYQQPWFEWDASIGYDYTKNKKLLTGISYTHYFFADSSDVPLSPINNEVFAYFYYRGWWLEPGVSLDYGWGTTTAEGLYVKETMRGTDFNVITTLRHPFIFTDIFSSKDAVLLTPSVSLTTGTANYYSNLKSFQYFPRSPKMKRFPSQFPFGREYTVSQVTDFQPRALDLTVSMSYLFGKISLSPSYTIFKTFNMDETGLLSYFTARLSYIF